MVNDPGSALGEAPALAAFLPALARRLLGEDLQLASQATLWLGEGAMVRTVLRDLEGWLIRKATDGNTPPVVPMMLSAADREELAARIAAHPSDYAASVAPTPSVAPCAGEHGLEPKPIDLNEAVQGMRDLLESTMGGSVQIETLLRRELWPALVDPTQIELVVLNLAINARDAMEVGGRLTVETCNVTLCGTLGTSNASGPRIGIPGWTSPWNPERFVLKVSPSACSSKWGTSGANRGW